MAFAQPTMSAWARATLGLAALSPADYQTHHERSKVSQRRKLQKYLSTGGIWVQAHPSRTDQTSNAD